MFVVALVGSIFSYFGLLLLLQYLIYARYGTKREGRVRAIEKYVSYDNKNRAQTYYRAIVEYVCDGKSFFMKSGGSSNLSYELHQKIPYYILNNNPKNVLLSDGTYKIFILVFILIGGGANLFYFKNAGDTGRLFFLIIYPILPILSVIAIVYHGTTKKNLSVFVKNSNVFEHINFDDPNIYDTPFEYDNEKRKYYQMSYLFSLIITLITSAVFALFWQNQKQSHKDEIFSYLKNMLEFNMAELANPSKSTVGFLVISFFLIIGFVSFILALKNKE